MPHTGKPIIYQLLVRLFGNTNTTNKFHGSIEDNGCGKFNDISETAISEIKKLGATHIWYTGIIAHASTSSYDNYGIPGSNPLLVKGRAGSPYAVRDYFDVSPDLAQNIEERMLEFESLVKRTHQQQLKVVIDFIPNHVARQYFSVNKPSGIKDLGQNDDRSVAFSPLNDFYYIPGQRFIMPENYKPEWIPEDQFNAHKDYEELPAKASGNNVFSPAPAMDDWFETVKLNYGVNYSGNEEKHFDPIPPLWEKMFEILSFWARKGVDAFRCDMAEMVPVEFWNCMIPKLKERFPGLEFIAEIYNPALYQTYLDEGKFDFLYEKVGFYDTIRPVIKGESHSDTIQQIFLKYKKWDAKLLRFLENHDEQRIASPWFAGDPFRSIAGMTVTATIGKGPVMIYFGQEVGEAAEGKSGFSGNDGRTTIFDYFGVPAHQQWMNEGKFDGGKLSEESNTLRKFYTQLLSFCRQSKVLTSGETKFWADVLTPEQKNILAFSRENHKCSLIVIANFSSEDFQGRLDAGKMAPGPDFKFSVVLGNDVYKQDKFLRVEVPGNGALVILIE